MFIWFGMDEVKVNNDKFRLIVFDRPGKERAVTINVGESIIKNQPVVKLLGLHVDSLLSFISHVDEICRNVGRKINVSARLSKTMITGCKLLLF